MKIEVVLRKIKYNKFTVLKIDRCYSLYVHSKPCNFYELTYSYEVPSQ